MTCQRGQKTRRAPGFGLRRPSASPSPYPSLSSSVPSSLALHSGTPPPPYKPASFPCTYGKPHPASLTLMANNKLHLSSYTSSMTPRSLGTIPTHPFRPPSQTYLVPPPP